MAEEEFHMTDDGQAYSSARPSDRGNEMGRLDSWKEIANFFRREVRTVQLWERHEHLPVRRHHHRKVGTVHAYRRELQEWWDRRCSAQHPVQAAVAPSPPAVFDTASSRPQASLAVPLFTISSDSGLEPEAVRRLTEQLVAHLETTLPPRLCVVSNLTAAQRHAGGFKSVPASCGTGSNFVLEGNVTGNTHSLAVRLELRRVKDRAIIWSRHCDCAALTLPEAARDLAGKIAGALSHHVLVSHYKVKSSTVDPAARFAYLRGRYLWSFRSTPDSVFKALKQFQLATELDHQYAAAFCGLADSYTVLGWFGALPREAAMHMARCAAATALAIDGFLAEAHVSMGCVLFDFDWDWQAAEREMLLGIDLNPSYAQAYCWYALLLISLERAAEAVQAAQVAQDLDPASPVVGVILGNALLQAGQHEGAIRQFQHVLELQPGHATARCKLGLAYEQLGDYSRAIEQVRSALRTCAQDPNIQSLLAFVYARSGNRDAAETLLGQLHRPGPNQPVPALDAAAAFTALGDP